MEILNIEEEWLVKPQYIRRAMMAARQAHIQTSGFAIDNFKDIPSEGRVSFDVSVVLTLKDQHDQEDTGMWTSWGSVQYETLMNPENAIEFMMQVGQAFASRSEVEFYKKYNAKCGVVSGTVWADKAQD